MQDSLLDKIKYFYWDHWPYDYRPGQIWYRIKCRFWHKYNIIKIKKLPSTWCDRDRILFHANMQILVDFIEREKPYEHIVIEGGNHDAEWAELKVIYDWYKKYPEPYKSQEEEIYKKLESSTPWEPFGEEDKETLSNGMTVYTMSECPEDRSKIYQELNDLENKLFNDEQDMLQRLIKIRWILWT